MRYLAIFELILISLGLIGFSMYLLLGGSQADTDQDTMTKSIRSGQLKTASLVVIDKYATGGRNDYHYILLSAGTSRSEISRAVPKAVYNKINIGDQFFSYDLGSDYMIPAFDNEQQADSWKLYAGTMSAFFAFAFVFAAYKIYKYGKLKDMIKFEMQYNLSGF